MLLVLLVLVKEILVLSLLERIKTKVEKLMLLMMMTVTVTTTTAGTCDGRRWQVRSGAPSSFRILLLLPLLQAVGRPLQTRPANWISAKGRGKRS